MARSPGCNAHLFETGTVFSFTEGFQIGADSDSNRNDGSYLQMCQSSLNIYAS